MTLPRLAVCPYPLGSEIGCGKPREVNFKRQECRWLFSTSSTDNVGAQGVLI